MFWIESLEGDREILKVVLREMRSCARGPVLVTVAIVATSCLHSSITQYKLRVQREAIQAEIGLKQLVDHE